MFDKALDFENLGEKFAVDDRLRVGPILDPVFAENTATAIEASIDLSVFIYLQGRPATISREQLQQFSPEKKAEIHTSLMQDATKGVGYHYNAKHVSQDETGPIGDFVRFLNHPDTLAKIRQVSGKEKITHADAQVTQYVPGQFLTRHSDNIAGETRELAYVFSFTRNWHPDWGGLLQFYEKDGTPRDAWSPSFNTLSLFDVRHVHAVTFVAPFAGGLRHSITGWFRRDS